MPNLLLDLEVDRVDLVNEGANSEAFIKLYKRKEKQQMDLIEILSKMKPEHAEVINAAIAKAAAEVPDVVTAEITKAKDALTLATEAVKKATEEKAALEAELQKTSSGTKTEEDIMKGLDPAVQEIFKALKNQKEAAEVALKEVAKQNEHKDAVAKASALKALPVDQAKLVEVIKGLSPEVMEILKSANAALEGSDTFGEVGKGKQGSDSALDAWSKIEKKAEGLRAEDSALTSQQAISRVIKENPKMYKAYKDGGAN